MPKYIISNSDNEENASLAEPTQEARIEDRLKIFDNSSKFAEYTKNTPVNQKRLATVAEIMGILGEKESKPLLAALISAIKRVADLNEDWETLKTYNIDQLWELMTAPPWVKPFIPALKEQIAEQIRLNPKISINELSSNINLKIRPEPGFIAVVDLNGYSNFQYEATDAQKAKLDEDYQRKMFELCKKYDLDLLQAPAGDAYVFYVPDNLQNFLSALKDCKIPVPLGNPDRNLYPDGFFTFSTGVAKANKDFELHLYTGIKGSDAGLIDVDGPAYVEAVELQKHVGKNQIQMDPETLAYLAKNSGAGTLNKRNDEPYRIPENLKEAVALMLALGQASHPRGCLSSIDKHSRGKESSVNALGVTSMAFCIGALSDLGNNQRKFAEIIRQTLALQNKYPDFFLFKKDGEKIHIHTKLPLNEKNGKLIISFCKEMIEIITRTGLEVGVGVGYTDTMVRTRIIDSSLEERAGAGIVKSVRLAARSRHLFLEGEFCKKAFGNIFELETIKAKGGDIQCLQFDLDKIDPQNIEGSNPHGLEKEREAIEEFVMNVGSGSTTLRLYSDHNGAGVSALFRNAGRIGKKIGIEVLDLERVGQDSYGLIRSLITQIYKDSDPNIDAENLLINFNQLLADTELLNKPLLILVDEKNLTGDERNLLEKLITAIQTGKTAMIYTANLPGQELKIEALNNEDAAKLIMEINTEGLDPILHLTPLENALKTTSEEEALPLTPRNLIHVFNYALKKDGIAVYFDKRKLREVKTGELGKKLSGIVEGENDQAEIVSISEERQFILGLVASVRYKLGGEHLWTIYSKLKNIDENDHKKKSIFFQDLEYLKERELLEKTEESYDLKDKNERESAMMLAVKDEALVSKTLVMNNSFGEITKVDSENIAAADAQLEHLLVSAAPNSQIRDAVGKIADYYYREGKTAEARRVYTKFINKISPTDFRPENLDFLMSMALAFHTNDESQRKIAEEIYENIDSMNPSEAIKLKITWRLYRLSTLDSKNNQLQNRAKTIISSSTDESELEKIFEMRERHSIFSNFILKLNNFPDSVQKQRIISTIKMDDLLRKVYTLRTLRPRVKKGELVNFYERKNAEFKERLIELSLLEKNGDPEIEATFLRLQGGVTNQLGMHEAAIPIFEMAGELFAQMTPPDRIQINDSLQGELETFNELSKKKCASPEVSREEMEKILSVYSAKIRRLEENSIVHGDLINRINAAAEASALEEYTVRTVAKEPAYSDKKKVAETVRKCLQQLDNFKKLKIFQTKGQGIENIESLHSQGVSELKEAIDSLPPELRP